MIASAYPRLKRNLNDQELATLYTPTETELARVHANATIHRRAPP